MLCKVFHSGYKSQKRTSCKVQDIHYENDGYYPAFGSITVFGFYFIEPVSIFPPPKFALYLISAIALLFVCFSLFGCYL